MSERIIVGTLRCAEGGWKEHCNCLARQTVSHCRIVIEGLPMVEAHRVLFGSFIASDADYLLKLDADIELTEKNALARMLRAADGKDSVSSRVRDALTGAIISGINLYSRRVDFGMSRLRGNLPRCDDGIVNMKRFTRLDAQFGYHMRHATPPQAFAAGYNRFSRHDRHASRGQHDQRKWTKQVVKRCRDKPNHAVSGHALRGIVGAIERASAWEGDYLNPGFREFCATFAIGQSRDKLIRQVEKWLVD